METEYLHRSGESFLCSLGQASLMELKPLSYILKAIVETQHFITQPTEVVSQTLGLRAGVLAKEKVPAMVEKHLPSDEDRGAAARDPHPNCDVVKRYFRHAHLHLCLVP
jgi:hypothetical protein